MKNEKFPIESPARIGYERVVPTIGVRDIRAAQGFYARVLGFRTVFENGDPVGFAVLVKDRAEIHLCRTPDHAPPPFNVMHLMVDDVDGLFAICQANGVRIVKPLTNKDYGQRAFVFADPDGNGIDVGERVGGDRPARP